MLASVLSGRVLAYLTYPFSKSELIIFGLQVKPRKPSLIWGLQTIVSRQCRHQSLLLYLTCSWTSNSHAHSRARGKENVSRNGAVNKPQALDKPSRGDIGNGPRNGERATVAISKRKSVSWFFYGLLMCCMNQTTREMMPSAATRCSMLAVQYFISCAFNMRM